MGLINLFKRNEPAPAPAEQPKPTAAARAVRRAVRFFQAAKTDNLTSKWSGHPLTADDVVMQNQRILVARSREQAANNDYAKSFVRMVRQNVIGHQGITLQAQAKDADGSLDDIANDAIEAAFKDFSKKQNCDITGRQTLREMCVGLVGQLATDGEFMVKKVFGRQAGKYRFALQVLDPQRCPPDFNQEKLNNGNFVRAGIEFNQYGKPVAYYFTTTRASSDPYIYTYGGKSYQRIDASEIIHDFRPDMVNQKRGLPMMATALLRLHMLNGFENSALVNARVSASKMGWFQWKDGYGPEDDEPEEEVYMESEPGSWREIPAGMDVKEHNPTYPNGEFAQFRKAMLQGISSGLGVVYNNLAKDLEGVNYSSIRQGTLDERDYWKEIQQWFIEAFMQPVFDEWLPLALLVGIRTRTGGTLRAEQGEKYSAVEWIGRRWQWVDPRADSDAAIKQKNAGLAAPSQILREQGKDPEETYRQISQDIERMRAAGIPDEFIMASLGLTNTQPQNDDEGEEDEKS